MNQEYNPDGTPKPPPAPAVTPPNTASTTTPTIAPTVPDPNNPNTVAAGDLTGATSRFQSEFGQADASGAGLASYQNFRKQGQFHEQAYQSAAKAQGWGNSGNAPTSPVTATGGIPPPAAPVAQAAPQVVGARPDARTPGATPAMPTYSAAHFDNTLTPTNISQFNAPDQSGVNNQQTSLLNAIMARPETMDAQTVAQLKEQSKEQALLLGKQSNSAFAQGAVGRGTLGGGQTDAFRQNTDSNVNNAILSGNRSVDLAAIAQNRQDQLNALTASSGIAQDQLGRATSSYGTGLSGELASDSSKLAHSQFGFGVDQANANQQQLQYQSEADANNAAYKRALDLAQNAQSVYGQDVATQFGNQASGLDLQKFLEMQKQFGITTGFNYDQLAQGGVLAQNEQALKYR